MNETNYTYGLMTISEIPTTKIQQKNAISKFSRLSATNPPTKCYAREKQRALWSTYTRDIAFLLKRFKQL